MPLRLLYFSACSLSGLADYAREQANAICGQGVEVTLLTGPEFKSRPQDHYELLPQLPARQLFGSKTSRLSSRFATVRQILGNVHALSNFVTSSGCKHILCGSYAEYLAPLWSGQLRRLAGKGVVFGTVVHDPVRDYVVGPTWWHRRSVACAYSFLREAFVHEPVSLDTVQPMPRLRTTVIPHGPYNFPPPAKSRETTRKELNIPVDARVLLSFGGIRDGKNLDLTLPVLAKFPDVFLIVAGMEQSQGQKPVSFYQQLAAKLGVANRCRWVVRFLGEEEIGNFFNAADLILLTYSRNFRSASGVLNVAARYRKLCLASSGHSNLERVVKDYNLGIWVKPDSERAITEGMFALFSKPPFPDWKRYEEDNSWTRNAQLVIDKMFDN